MTSYRNASILITVLSTSIFAALSACSDYPAESLQFEGSTANFVFNPDGSKLLVASTVGYVQGTGFTEIIWTVFEVDSWKTSASHRTTNREPSYLWVCRNPGTFASLEYDLSAMGRYLVVRKFDTGEELNAIAVTSDVYGFGRGAWHCDEETGMGLITLRPDVVSAVDMTTGQVAREYPGGGEDGILWIQRARDRLVIVDWAIGVYTTYRLSSGELIGSVCGICGFPGEILSGHAMLDDDHIMVEVVTGEAMDMHVFLVVVDLEALEIERTYDIGNYGPIGFGSMDSVLDTYYLFLAPLDQWRCYILAALDAASGEIRSGPDDCEDGLSFGNLLRDKRQVWMLDQTDRSAWKYVVYDFPSFRILGRAPVPRVFLPRQIYAPGIQRIFETGEAVGDFVVYDPNRIALLDHFKLCDDGIVDIGIDPTERWLAARCYDQECDVQAEPMTCSGKGVVVLDLDRYR
ncbi:MAG TPA: hypothetical protein PK668_04110 [Myxococcota bacterium]|nr:hypothetical protein [Myxococcota bacterium]HRY92043.1 hypothetical protein [Myxococcota bacterium]